MVPRTIDFATLSLQDALDLAILVEEEAKERYDELAHQMELHHNQDVGGFFRFMVKIEGVHEGRLEHRRTELFGAAPRRVRREMLFDVEAPDYDDVRANTTPRQALEVALRAEKKAHEFFTRALAAVKDPAVQALFAELCEDEVEHAGLVEQQLSRLPPDPVIKAEDVEDDPVAH